MSNSSKWDTRFLDLASLVSSWSKDPSTRVGAVIVDRDNRVVSLGFNGFPAGVDDRVLSRDQKLLRTIHAERNALHFAHCDVSGCTIYVTHPPCSHCAADIIQKRIARVVFPSPDVDFIERWKESAQESFAMFSESGVLVSEITI